MASTGARNRLQDLRNENATNINPAKNQPINQPPKSAFKDLTNATKGPLNVFGGSKQGLSFRTPQVQKKNESTTKPKETIQIYMDDFCTSLPTQKFTEVSWTKSIETDKLADKIACFDCFEEDEHFKDVLEEVALPEPKFDFSDLDLPINNSFEMSFEMPDDVKPIDIEGLADLDPFDIDLNDFAF